MKYLVGTVIGIFGLFIIASATVLGIYLPTDLKDKAALSSNITIPCTLTEISEEKNSCHDPPKARYCTIRFYVAYMVSNDTQNQQFGSQYKWYDSTQEYRLTGGLDMTLYHVNETLDCLYDPVSTRAMVYKSLDWLSGVSLGMILTMVVSCMLVCFILAMVYNRPSKRNDYLSVD
jgi:ABC-type antimicrobial peptide transport system permease subunit